MSDLKKKFSHKEWKDCCGKGCKKCKIAQTYIGVYGKKKGLDKLSEDRAAMHSKKASGKKKSRAADERDRAATSTAFAP